MLPLLKVRRPGNEVRTAASPDAPSDLVPAIESRGGCESALEDLFHAMTGPSPRALFPSTGRPCICVTSRCPLPDKGDQKFRPDRKNTLRSAPPGTL